MTKVWALKHIDLGKAIEDIPSQDPQTALRFNLPVPNWLDQNGQPNFRHEKIQQKEDGSWRFFFQNHKDNCLQGVRIDGSSVITFMGPTPAQSQSLVQLVREYSDDVEQLTPEQISDILERAHTELGLRDMYNNGRKNVESYMHSYVGITTGHKSFGPFLPKPTISTAVYIQGAGVFSDGPTATPQRFESGAFISFPGQRKEQILQMSPEGMLASKNFTVKLVQSDVFVSSRTYANGNRIETDKLPHQISPSSSDQIPSIKLAPQP
jgi:hypothetical protein